MKGKLNTNKIITEWAYRLSNGTPNLGNRFDLHVLRQVLVEQGYPHDFVKEYMQNLEEDDIVKNKKSGNQYVVKSHNPETQTIITKDASAAEIEKAETGEEDKLSDDDLYDKVRELSSEEYNNLAHEYDIDPEDSEAMDDFIYSLDADEIAKVASEIDKGEYGTGQEQPIDPDGIFGGDVQSGQGKKTQSKFAQDEIEERFNIDKGSVKSSLYMTKDQAKAQALQTGKKDVGLGSAPSRAGEAMVHTGVQMLLSGQSAEEIESTFNEIVNTPGHILNSKSGKKWVGACMATLKKINEEIGIENIQNVAWDTDQGREAIGVDPKTNTSSDMFIQKNDGTVVGISLKKDGNVFIVSGGWEKQAGIVLDNLKDHMSPEAHAELSEAMSIEVYTKDLGQRIERTLDAVGPQEIAQSVEKLKVELAEVGENRFFKGKNLPKYLAVLENPEELHNKILLGPKTADNPDGASAFEIKAFIKIVQYNHPEQNKDLRGVDGALNKRMYDAMNKSPEAKSGMKQFVIRSMHLREALGLNEETKAGGIDEFITLYGAGDNGAVMNEETITGLFGSEFNETLKKVRAGEADASELDKIIEDKIEFDFENRKVVFKHENNKKYPLFTMGGRAKGLGGNPAMEIAQTPLMAYALEAGTFNSDEWPEDMQAKYKEQIGEDV